MIISFKESERIRDFLQKQPAIHFAEKVAVAFRRYLVGFYLAHDEESRSYPSAANIFWEECLNNGSRNFRQDLIRRLSMDRQAPAVIIGQSMAHAVEEGYDRRKNPNQHIDYVQNLILGVLR